MSRTVNPDRAALIDDLANSEDEARRLAVERLLTLPGREAVPHLIAVLGDPSWRVRKAAIEQLVACTERTDVASALIDALADGSNPGRRNAAVEALVRLGRAVTSPLVGALRCDDSDVRKLAIDSLAGIRDPGSRAALIESLADPDPNVRAAAADALGVVGGESVSSALSGVALRRKEDRLVRLSALRALARLECSLSASELADLLSDPILRSASFALLGYCDSDADAEQQLLEGLGMSSRTARESAVQALLRRLSRVDGSRAEALAARIRECARATPVLLPSILERLPVTERPLRLALVEFLGLLRAEESVVPILEVARDRTLAAVSLATLESFAAVAETVLDEVWDRLDNELRRIGCALLARTRGRRGTARLRASLGDPDTEVRAAAARALAERSAQEALPDLVLRMEAAALDDDPDAADELETLLEAITSLSESAPEEGVSRLVDQLVAPLGATAEAVRCAAAGVFARIARPQDGERLILLLKDPSASVRRLAVAGLARLDSDAALESVRLAVADESVRVRVAAAAALGASRRLQAVEDLERLALDEDLRVRSAALRAIGTHRACSREATAEDLVDPSALRARSVVGLSDTEFRTYCDLLRGYCGLHFDESSRFLLEKRVARRIRELDLESFAAYQYKLQSAEGDDEMAHLADVLTTNETYFFRERSQLSALVEEVVPELLRCSRRPIRIWSAGCSSGEEPYSVVALAREAGLDPARDIRVYASDISRQMLRRCRRGVYREASFRETSDELRARYFSEKDGLHQICDEIKRHVDFIHLNLLAESKLSLLGTMDVVLCRNVIIYFDAETKRRVIQSFYDRLRPGGYLLLGHSESLINVSSAFELARLERDLVYRRPVPGEKTLDPWHQIAGATSATLVDVDGSER